MTELELKQIVRDVPDFPKNGIVFKDITPLFQDVKANQFIFEQLKQNVKLLNPDVVVGIESRGFVYANSLALACDLPFVMARKKGKLPSKTISASYELEYGISELEMHISSIKKGDKVLIHDDLLATGGTVKCVSSLIERLGGIVVGFSFIIDLKFLEGNNNLISISPNLFSVLTYE